MQALLSQFLETSEIRPVGSDKLQSTRVDVRLISATKQDLMERCAQEEFRSDLFYRLNVMHIRIVPLRERRDDIPLLVAHFLAHYATANRVAAPELSSGALAALVDYDWPGNVRQLAKIVEQLTVEHSGRLLTSVELLHEVRI